jgi:hypothetical protein
MLADENIGNWALITASTTDGNLEGGQSPQTPLSSSISVFVPHKDANLMKSPLSILTL